MMQMSTILRPILIAILSLCFLIVRSCHGCNATISQQNYPTFSPGFYSQSVPGALNFLVVGDWGRQGNYNQSAVAAQMGVVGETLDVDFVISVGDNFYEDGLTGTDDSAFDDSFANIYTSQSLYKPWHVVLGNHDYRGDALAELDSQLILRDARWHCERAFVLRYFLEGSLEYVDFIFYDTNPFVKEYWNSTEHTYDWRGIEPKEQFIEDELKFLSSWLSSSNATWKIVIGHHPIRSVGEHGDTVELDELVYPILKENSVDLYINGHDHCLEHITQSGIEFLTSGGGSKAWRGMDTSANMTGLQFYYDGQGFMSMSISRSSLSFTFYDSQGYPLHSNNITKTTTCQWSQA